jgi:hypothetical protein
VPGLEQTVVTPCVPIVADAPTAATEIMYTIEPSRHSRIEASEIIASAIVRRSGAKRCGPSVLGSRVP